MEEKVAFQTHDATILKTQEIIRACDQHDVQSLVRLAESAGGFLNDGLRQRAWPIILGISTHEEVQPSEKSEKPQLANEETWQNLPVHRDEDQVQLDVTRAFVYYPRDQSDEEAESNRQALTALITQVLRRNPYLCYFQGYHDIAQVFLLTLAPALRYPLAARLSILRIRDFMLPNLHPAILQLRLIPDILHAADAKLWHHLSHVEPFFALSGTLTMYAHDIQSLGEIARLFDVLLAKEPVFSVYMFAQIILDRRAELFDTPEDEPEMLHSILSKLPQSLDLEALIGETVALLRRFPPERLGAWRAISRFSALKTARKTEECATQSLAVGREAFEKQVEEMETAEYYKEVMVTMKKYRGPAAAAAVAILVGTAAVLLRRSGR